MAALVWLHRWLGIGLGLLFALWFASGAVMIFVPYPSLDPARRIARLASVDLAEVRVTPADALAAAGLSAATRLRLFNAAGRPLYAVMAAPGQAVAAVDARNGARVTLGADEARRIAQAFAGAPVRRVDGPFDYDQWVVHQRFDAYRPLFRIAIDDAPGTELYVSARAGVVVQETTQWARTWNYAGAVVHWIYPTVLRRDWAAWNATVWTLALLGIVMAAIGTALGVIRLVQARARFGVNSPFRGWLRWHHWLGLAGAAFVLSWIFSGWLSMDHGLLFPTGEPDARRAALFRGTRVGDVAGAVSLATLTRHAPFTELEIVPVGGQAWLIAHKSNGTSVSSAVSSTAVPDLHATLPDAVLLAAVRAAWPEARSATIAAVAADDPYAWSATATARPNWRRVDLDGALSVTVDADNGDLVSVLDGGRRAYRWLFNGLHNFDWPGLANRPFLRIGLMLPLLALGFALSITGVVIGMRRLFSRRPAALSSTANSSRQASPSSTTTCSPRSPPR